MKDLISTSHDISSKKRSYNEKIVKNAQNEKINKK